MNHWMKTAKENLLRSSINKENFSEAKKEWQVTSRIFDNFGDDADFSETAPCCELCEHENLRWQFEIINTKNSLLLLVGSTCIKQFDIPIINEDLSTLTGEERDRTLQKRIDDQKKEKNHNEILEKLRKLWKKDKQNREKIEFIAKHWKKENKFDPIDAYFIRSRLINLEIPLGNCRMEVNLRSLKNKLQIVSMPDKQIDLLTEILTSAQKKALTNLKEKYAYKN